MKDKILLLPQNRAIKKQVHINQSSGTSSPVTGNMSGSNTETLKFRKTRKQKEKHTEDKCEQDNTLFYS